MSDDPKRSQFIRCPMPPFANVSPDTLRNFYEPGVSQFRVFPPAAINGTPQKGAKGDPGKAGEAAPAPSTTITPSAAALRRTTVPLTTGTLASNAQETGTVMLGKTFSLMQVNVSGPCRVRLYSNTDFRDADISSGRGLVAPSAYVEHGIIADIVFTDNWHFAGTGSWTTESGGSLLADGYQDKEHNNTPTTGKCTTNWVGTIPAVGTAVRLMIGQYNDARFYELSARFSTQPYSAWTPWRAAGYPLGSGSSLGSFLPTGVTQYGSEFLVPVGAQSVLFQAVVPMTFAGTYYNSHITLEKPTATVITPDPLTWVCSPEAPGSDCSAYPTGDIAYCIDNLLPASSAVTANFTILREEK